MIPIQLTRMAEPIPPSGQSSSYSLTTLSSSSSTDRRAETDRMVITTRIAVAHHFTCRLRRRESCILGATSSQPTLPLHELPPAKLVIHRQTSNHERRKGTLIVQSRSGILADFKKTCDILYTSSCFTCPKSYLGLLKYDNSRVLLFI